MSNTHSSFLKEMGITEWVARDGTAPEAVSSNPVATEEAAVGHTPNAPRAHWWFFGAQPLGDAQLLFQNLIRVLGLASNEWSWKNPGDNLSKIQLPENGMPVVAFAFGGPTAQKITGERDTGNDDEIPVVASFDLAQLATKSKEKAMLWQDLLLAKSVLQNI